MTAIGTDIDRGTSALEQALAGAPFYERWRACDPGPSVSLAMRMVALPVLTKRDLRAHIPHGFIQHGHDSKAGFASGEIEMVSTSGTVEERVSVVWNQAWWDRSEQEAARLHPVLHRVFGSAHREAVLTTPLSTGNRCHVCEVPLQERIVGNVLFLNQSLEAGRDPVNAVSAGPIRTLGVPHDPARPQDPDHPHHPPGVRFAGRHGSTAPCRDEHCAAEPGRERFVPDPGLVRDGKGRKTIEARQWIPKVVVRD